MAKKNFEPKWREKKALGELIAKLRKGKNVSMRKFSEAIGISPSNIFYIESGINVPTSSVYERMIEFLQPTLKEHKKLDHLYTTIRKSPPPDVCEILLRNTELGETLKLLADVKLSPQQLGTIEELFATFRS